MQQLSPLHNHPSFNLKEELFKYISKWKWFLAGIFLTVALAYTYLRYSIPQYKAVGTILVKDDRKGSIASEMSAFSDLGLLSNVKSNVDNEIEVIKSRSIIEKTVKDLELNYSYFNLGRVKSEEIYKQNPIKIVFVDPTPEFINANHYFIAESISEDQYALYDEASVKIGTFKYKESFVYKGTKGALLKTEYYKNFKDFYFGIQIRKVSEVVENFKARLTAATISKYTSVIELSIIDPVRAKAEDFINTLVINYNKDAVDDKKYISENTSKFIEQRLEIISEELKDVEKEVEDFKKKNHVTDIISEAGLFLESSSDFEKRQIEVETQLKVVSSMLDYIKNESNDVIPANIIPAEEGAASQIDEYNTLIIERNKLLKTAGEKNVRVQNLDRKIEAIRQNVQASLVQLQNNLKIKNRDISRQNAVLSGRISQVPTQEKIFRDIDRKQNVKEALYLYLLQKREETAISLAVTAPNAKVIDNAVASVVPVAPNRRLIYLAALFLGFLIPFVIIYIMNLLDTKVKSRSDLEGKLSIPFLGEVQKCEKDNLLIKVSDRTNTAEAIRIIRTNLEFLLSNVNDNRAKTIFLTSTYPKEGKTFISVNLASIIAHSERKVLLIGMDIRNPKLDEYFKVPQKGLTSYLTDKNGSKIEDYIVKVDEVQNLDVLPSGIIPPNPAELLMSDKLGKIFSELQQKYDYIIVDTAPVSLVSDTLIVAKYADAFVYVTRANFSDKRMLELPEKLYRENKLPNMSVILNDTDVNKGYGYGYSYGYGYGQQIEKKSLLERIFKR